MLKICLEVNDSKRNKSADTTTCAHLINSVSVSKAGGCLVKCICI